MRQNRSHGEGEIVRRAQALVWKCATVAIVAGAAAVGCSSMKTIDRRIDRVMDHVRAMHAEAA